MSLQSQIDKDYIAAYKAKETVKVAVLRHLKTAIKNRVVELGQELSDDDVMDLIAKQAKQRRDSIDQYNKANRPELAEVEAAELVELEAYMPTQLSEDELKAAIDVAVDAIGASGMQDMGKVMQQLMQTHKGQIDGKLASALVRARLTAS